MLLTSWQKSNQKSLSSSFLGLPNSLLKKKHLINNTFLQLSITLANVRLAFSNKTKRQLTCVVLQTLSKHTSIAVIIHYRITFQLVSDLRSFTRSLIFTFTLANISYDVMVYDLQSALTADCSKQLPYLSPGHFQRRYVQPLVDQDPVLWENIISACINNKSSNSPAFDMGELN